MSEQGKPIEEKPKRKPETMWRLVESQCRQLADAVASARIPFLLALTWAFFWAWSLYISEYGYLTLLSASLSPLGAEFSANNPKENLIVYCNKKRPMKDPKVLTDPEKAECKKAWTLSIEHRENQLREQEMVTFPGGFPKTHIFDLGIVGLIGMNLIHSWLFFAIRRENHAISTFVDFDNRSYRSGKFIPKSYNLVPQDINLSPEHLVYAYHAVSQRFIFLFSRRSKPLLVLSSSLFLFPAIVPAWNFYTDFRDLLNRDPFSVLGLSTPPQLWLKTFMQFLLVILDWLLVYSTLRFSLRSTTILNGWYLACHDVWTKLWDETIEGNPSPTVHIESETQRASLHSPKLN